MEKTCYRRYYDLLREIFGPLHNIFQRSCFEHIGYYLPDRMTGRSGLTVLYVHTTRVSVRMRIQLHRRVPNMFSLPALFSFFP